MKLPPFILLAALFAAASVLARADYPLPESAQEPTGSGQGSGAPSFERDARPILAQQPGLVKYVHAHFVVKETGVARIPGSADQPPQPPFIFSARPRGNSGPFYLRLLIQPGPAGRILKVADIRQVPQGMPAPEPAETAEAPALAPTQQPIGSPEPTQAPPASTTSPSPPNADTPSGPIRD